MNSKDETLFSSPLLEARIHRVISMGRERDRKREREEDLEEGGKEIDNGKREDAKSKRKMEYSSGSESDSDSGGGSESSESGDERRHKRSKRKHRSSKRRSRKRHSDEYSDSDSGSSSYESDSDSEDSLSESEDERRRRKRKERKKREERDRKRRRREKEKKRGRRDEDDEKSQKKKKTDKEKKKKKKKDKGKKGPVTNSWGKYGIIKEVDMWNKRPEFTAWLLDVKQVNLESLPNYEEKNMYKEYMEDYNTATLPSKKYYNLDIYHKNKLSKQMRKGMKKVVAKERTVFNDEEQRRLELMQEREKQKQQEVVSLKNAMQSGMAQAMKEQARLKEEMQYLYKVGNYEAAAVIQRKLDPDVAM